MGYRRTAYTYDSDGRVATCSVYLASDAQTASYVYTYSYNASGKLSGYTVTTPSGTKTIAITYGTNGRISQVTKTTT
mgnify:CR=1 FL=1